MSETKKNDDIYYLYSRLFNSSGARRLFFGKFSTEYKLITVATIIDFCIVSQ